MGRKKDNWKYLALALLIIFGFFFGTQGTWQPKDFDWGNLLNASTYTIVPYPPATPPLNETPPITPPITPPADDGVGGAFAGYDTCQNWAVAKGKDHVSIGPTSLFECEDFAWHYCENMGKHLDLIDWTPPNCCIWKCTA